MKPHQLVLAVSAALLVGGAHAYSFTLPGTLSSTDGIFNRPVTLTSLSDVGTAVYYDSYTYSGMPPGSYDFLMTGTFDTYLLLYAGTFNAASPLTNLVALNDDCNSSRTSSCFSYTLAPATSYTVVSTSYNNAATGSYTATITSMVPEPETVVLMLAGLGAVGVAARRRSTV